MRVALALGLVAALAACSKPKATPGATSTASAPLELPPFVPASAIVIVGFDAPLDWLTELSTAGGMSVEAAHALRDDVALYVKKSTGLDLAKVHRGTLFVTPGSAALVLRDVGGEWKTRPLEEDVKVARQGEYFIVGAAAAVDEALAVAAGKAPGLAKDAPLATLFAKESLGAAFAIAGDLAQFPEPEIQEKAAQVGVTHAFVSFGRGGLHVVAHGDGQKMGALVAMLEQQLARMAAEAEKGRVAALEGASLDKGVEAEPFGQVWAAHSLKQMALLLHPKVDGNDVRLDLHAGSGNATVLVAVVGMGAAVAIPAFMKYMRKSKSMEAVAGIKKIYDGARAQFLETGKLPKSIPATPPPGTCCKQPGGECQPDAALWTAWKELSFELQDPYKYSYELESDGTTFTARALGDLDCDGVYSTFELAGMVQPDGTLKGAQGIYMNLELE